MPVDLTNPAAAQGRGKTVLALLGSFWTSVYNDNGMVAQITRARNEAELQTFRDLLELVACACRFDIPIYHKVNWSVLTIRASEVQEGSLLTFGEGAVFGNSPGSSGIVYRYGISPTSITAYSHPPRLTDVSVIVNRISEPSVTLTKEIDFRVDATNGAIEFREDPFSDPLNISYPVYDSAGNHIDNELQLWMFMADYDWQLLYEQFGYALNVYLESSENYKNLINLLWDSLVQGSTAEHLEYLLAIVSDTPLVIETSETVEVIHTETDRLLIITDRHVYIFGVTATPIVTVGQVLKSGDRMVDAFTIYRPHRDTVPSSVMPSISVGPGVLQGSYASELIFNNRDVELQVTIDPAGRTKIQWELGGIADDVNLFWDTVHFNGTTGSAISLAQLMDTRYPPAQSPDPTAVNLPTTVNPFTFLMTNVFRNNALVVVLNTRSFGTNALGTSTPRGFRQVIPAHNMVFVMVQIVLSDSIIMDGIGDSSSAGYDETVTGGTFIAPDPLSESSPHSFFGTDSFSFT